MDENDRKPHEGKAAPVLLARVFDPSPSGKGRKISDDQERDGDKWPRTRKDKWEAAAILAAIILVAVNFGQAWQTQQSLKLATKTYEEAKASSAQSDLRSERMVKASEAQALAVTKASEEMTRSNKAMEGLVGTQNQTTKESVSVARYSAASSREAIVAVNQPYIALSMEPMKIEKGKAADLEYDIGMANQGKTAAKRATRCFAFNIARETPRVKLFDTNCAEIRDEASPIDMPPTQSMKGHAARHLEASEIDELYKDRAKLFLLGKIGYSDEFGAITTKEYCFRWQHQDSLFAVCTEREQRGDR